MKQAIQIRFHFYALVYIKFVVLLAQRAAVYCWIAFTKRNFDYLLTTGSNLEQKKIFLTLKTSVFVSWVVLSTIGYFCMLFAFIGKQIVFIRTSWASVWISVLITKLYGSWKTQFLLRIYIGSILTLKTFYFILINKLVSFAIFYWLVTFNLCGIIIKAIFTNGTFILS